MPATDEKEIVSPGQSEPAAHEVLTEASSSERAAGFRGWCRSACDRSVTKPGAGG